MTTATRPPLSDVVPRVDQPRFDLRAEAWIDVIRTGGTAATVSLRELLLDAHEISRLDDSRVGALVVHALTRLTIGYAHLLHAHSPSHDWQATATGDLALPPNAVAWLLDERLDSLLWLEHPSRPFLQRPDVLAVMDATLRKEEAATLIESTDPYWALRPDVPSKSNPSWFNRYHELPPPTDADVANALVLRHFFGLPGNEAPNRRAGTKNSKGGPTRMSPVGRSYFTLAGPTLAQTLTRNLLHDWLDLIVMDTPAWWDTPDELASNIGNPLWIYTASAAVTVAVRVPADVDPVGWRAVRTPTPIPKEQHDVLKEALQDGDPHTLRVDSAAKSQKRSYVSFHPDAHPAALLHRFHGNVDRSALHSPSLLRPSATRYGAQDTIVEALHLSGGGSATGPTITGSAVTRHGREHLLLPADRARVFANLADRVVGRSGSAATRVAVHARLALGATGNHQLRWVWDDARRRMYIGAETALRTLLDLCAEPSGSPPTDVPDRLWDDVVAAALAAYDAITEPHTGTAATLAAIVERRILLRRDLLKERRP